MCGCCGTYPFKTTTEKEERNGKRPTKRAIYGNNKTTYIYTRKIRDITHCGYVQGEHVMYTTHVNNCILYTYTVYLQLLGNRLVYSVLVVLLQTDSLATHTAPHAAERMVVP